MKQILLQLFGLAVCYCSHAGQSPPPATTDYAYFDGKTNQQRVVVIGADFAKDVTKINNCQTRTRKGDTVSEWHDAIDIIHADEDQYRFRTTDNSEAAPIVEARVMGADGNYTEPVNVGDGTHYRERFLTAGSPHNCLGKTVEVRWYQLPKPQLGSAICTNISKHALVCQNKRDYVVVGGLGGGALISGGTPIRRSIVRSRRIVDAPAFFP